MPSSEGVSIALLFLLSAKHMPCPQLGRRRGKQQSHQRMYVADCATVFQRRQEIGRRDTIPSPSSAFRALWGLLRHGTPEEGCCVGIQRRLTEQAITPGRKARAPSTGANSHARR